MGDPVDPATVATCTLSAVLWCRRVIPELPMWLVNARDKLHKAYPNDRFECVTVRNGNPPALAKQRNDFDPSPYHDISTENVCYDSKVCRGDPSSSNFEPPLVLSVDSMQQKLQLRRYVCSWISAYLRMWSPKRGIPCGRINLRLPRDFSRLLSPCYFSESRLPLLYEAPCLKSLSGQAKLSLWGTNNQSRGMKYFS